MEDRKLLDECREMLLDIAPELRERPLYLKPAAFFDSLPMNTDCYGWANSRSSTDYTMRDLFGEEWQGPGAIIALDLPMIRDHQGHMGDEFVTQYIRSVAIHEAAHVVPPPIAMRDSPDTPGLRAAQMRMHEIRRDAPDVEPGERFDAHDWRFTRRACHLYYRAVLKGYDCTSWHLVGGEEWRTTLMYYVFSLLGEVGRLQDADFRTIEDENEPPQAFLDIWQGDLDRYRKYFQGKDA